MAEKAISSDLIRGHIDTIILHTLLNGDKHAQQISDTVELKSDKQYGINQATLYSSLKRLENLKYVNAFWHDSEDGRRRFFRITESGKKTIANNLSDWSFSRAIIDKLIDYQSPETEQPKPKVIALSLSDSTSQNNDCKVFDKDNSTTQQDNISKFPFNFTQKVDCEQKIDEFTVKDNDSSKKEESYESVAFQEINYKNILNGLIKATECKQIKENTEILTPLNLDVVQPQTFDTKTKFTDSLNLSVDITKKTSYDGKIDYSDLIEKADNEGYTVRISSKGNKQRSTSGTVFKNRVSFVCSLAIFLLTLLELLFFSIQFKPYLPVTPVIVSLSIAGLMVFPIVMAVVFFKSPLKTSKPLKIDVVYTVAIIIFNLILITFAGNLLFNIDFNDTSAVLYSLIIPITLYLDTVCYFILKYIFSKTASFKVKINS